MATTGGYQSAGLRRRERVRRFRLFGWTFLAGILLTGSFYLLIGSDIFVITSLRVEGVDAERGAQLLERLKPQVAKTTRGALLGTSHYLSWDGDLVYADSGVKEITLEKNLLKREVVIRAQPRIRYGVWCRELPEELPNCFWIDDTGLLFEGAPLTEGQLVIKISEYASGTPLFIGSVAYDSAQWEIVRAIAEATPVLQLPIRALSIARELQEVHVVTIGGTKITFSLRFDPSHAALPGLKKLMESPGLSKLSEIDFTVENRVFYKVR